MRTAALVTLLCTGMAFGLAGCQRETPTPKSTTPPVVTQSPSSSSSGTTTPDSSSSAAGASPDKMMSNPSTSEMTKDKGK